MRLPAGIAGLLLLHLPHVYAQDDDTAVAVVSPDSPMQRLQEQWLLFAILGAIAVVSFAALIILSRKKDPGPDNRSENITPFGSRFPSPPSSPVSSSMPSGSSSYPVPSTGVAGPSAPSPPPASAPMVSATPPPAPVSTEPTDSFPAPATADSSWDTADVDGDEDSAPVEYTASRDAGTIFVASDSEHTVDADNPTITILPGYFEVLQSKNPDLEPLGTRKRLYAMNNNPNFAIARPTNNQELIANFLPLRSKKVSRTPEKQGKLVYDFVHGTYTVVNFADPAHPDPKMRCSPIRVAGRALKPGEEATIQPGDELQIGDIVLGFYRDESRPRASDSGAAYREVSSL
ncbi:MAG: hypothetical protein OHK0029_01650 [Armatimonadaceae bacterium]